MHEEILECYDEHPPDIPQADLDEMLRDAHERDDDEQSEQESNSQVLSEENVQDYYITNADENKSDKPIQCFENLPDEILNAPRFFLVGKDKVPLTTGWSKPENQRDYRDVKGVAGFDTCGRGQAVDYLLLDFDHVLTDSGEFVNETAEKWFKSIHEKLGSFCERSISGHGLHIFAKPTADQFAPISNGKNGVLHFGDGAKLELFYKSKGRYCLVTGDVFECAPKTAIASGEVVDEVLQKLLDAIQKQLQAKEKPAAPKSEQPADSENRNSYTHDTRERENEDEPEYDMHRARLMLDCIDPSTLDDSDWFAVISACKNIGIDYPTVDAWNRRDPERYAERENQTRWNSATDPSFNIETLHGKAKRFGYDERTVWHEWHAQHPNSGRINIQQFANTTQFKITSCPVDLVIPPDVQFGYSGITLKESRGEDKPPRYLTAATTPIVPTKIFRDENSGLVQYELAILTQSKWRRHVVDGRTIQSPRCVDKLANFGALIKPSPLCEYFTRIIAANSDRLKTWRVFAQPGWYDEKFQHFIYPTGGETYIVDRTGYNYKADYSERGNANEWRKVFCEAMKAGGRIARIFVGVAVASPLIRPLKITNLQAHLFGGVNAGKTVLARLIASIWGNPQELLRTFETSPKRRQADAAANNDLPTIYDELETVRGQRAEMSLTQSVYAFFNGKGNQNLNVDGTARDTFKFTGSRLSTGERQILKVADQFGAYKRLVPLECKGKIFDKQLATRLYRFTEDNFGHFGRGWTTYISEHLTAIREKYEAKERDLLAGETHEETQLRTICAACVAYQFFAQYLGLQDEFDSATFFDDATETIDELPTVEESSDSARAIDVLKDVVASNEDRFYMETLSTNTPRYHEAEPKANGEHWGKLYLDGAVAIYPTTLSDILVKKGFASPEMLIRTWNDEGKLIANEGRNTRQMRIGDTRQRTVYFKAGILSESREDKALNDDAPPS